LTKMSQHTIDKLIRDDVKRKTHEHVLKGIHNLQIDGQNDW
jgi:response regulator of citrate/malate metabolism